MVTFFNNYRHSIIGKITPSPFHRHKKITDFVLYLLPQLLWSALTKFDGGGEENGVKVRYQMEL